LFCLALERRDGTDGDFRHLRTASENGFKTPQVAASASIGNAGPQFESKLGSVLSSVAAR